MKLYIIQYCGGGVAHEPEVFIIPTESGYRWKRYFVETALTYDQHGNDLKNSKDYETRVYLSDADGDHEVRRWVIEI